MNDPLPRLAAIALLTLAACSSTPERNPLPEELVEQAVVPGYDSRIRLWGDEAPRNPVRWTELSENELEAHYPAVYEREHHYLAISGGGADGAFGAGILVGWTAGGTRPEFTLVSGISTGALTAPFAFLGSDWDDELELVYTAYSTEDLIEGRSLLATITGDSAADTGPLKQMIAQHMDQRMLDAIGAEFLRGRSLLIGTTNLDARRPVIWNIGRIATSGAPDALELFRAVLLASSSVPVAFPPVYIEVEAGGQRYDEMHVDGGATSQLFLYPLGMDWAQAIEQLNVVGRPQVYAIRNSKLSAPYEAVSPDIASIGGTTIASLLRTGGLGDMYRVYLGARRDGLDYHLAYIPESFTGRQREPFDREYMRALFALGRELGQNGYPWQTTPPGFEAE